MLHKSTGILQYSENPYKLVLSVDQEISLYYMSQIPKHIKVNRQKYPAHISIVRKEVPSNLQAWRKHEGKRMSFQYEHYLYHNDVYFWLNVYSSELEEIRKELGLRRTSAFTRGPDGKHKFHTTVCNRKPAQ